MFPFPPSCVLQRRVMKKMRDQPEGGEWQRGQQKELRMTKRYDIKCVIVWKMICSMKSWIETFMTALKTN